MDHWESPLGAGFHLGDWEISPQQNTICRGAQQCHLEPKVMEVLLYLAIHHGEVVRRDQLIEKVWRTVVGDEVLSRAIYLLRSSLGDDPRSPSFIQTVPKSGYRLLVKPEPLRPTTLSASSASIETRPQKHKLVRAVRTARATIGALSLLVLLLVWFVFRPGDDDLVGADQRNWFQELFAGNLNNSEVTSLAVLPFEDLSPEGDQSYLAESITDELISNISKIDGLRVVARRSVINLPEEIRDVKTIGRYFGVDAVLEGTIKVQENNVRIGVQVGSTQDGFVLWSDTYSDPKADLFNIQNAVLADLTHHLQSISPTRLVLPTQTTTKPDLAAYQLFLNGQYLLKLRGSGALHRSIDLFEQALELDPGFNRARLALAEALVLTPFYDDTEEAPTYQRVQTLLESINLDETQEKAEAESIKAFIAGSEWRWVDSELAYSRAVRLNPSDPETLAWYSLHLASVGRIEESRLVAAQAQELDQVSPNTNIRLAVTSLWADDDTTAAEYFARGAERGFSVEANLGYLIFLHRQKRWQEMRRLLNVILNRSDMSTEWADKVFNFFKGDGDREQAVSAFDQAIADSEVPPRMELPGWILLDKPERIIATIEKYRDHKKYLDLEFLFARESTKFRESPQFSRVVELTGLQDYWDYFGAP